MIAKFFKFSFGGWISAGIAFFSTPVISSLILPDEFGKASFVLLAYNFLLQIVLLGIDQSFVREYYALKEGRHLLFKKAMWLPLVISLAVAISLLAFFEPVSSSLIGQRNFEVAGLLALTIIVATVERFMTLDIRMAQRGVLFSVLKVVSSLITFFVIVLYAKFVSKDLLAIVYGNFVGLLVTALLVLIINRKTVFTRTIASYPKTNDLLKYGLPFVPTFIVGWVFEAIDRIALKEYSTFEELGLYSAAFKIVAALTILQTTFSTFWTPIAFEAYEKNDDATKAMFQQIFKVLSLVFFFCALLLISFKDLIIQLFSSEYLQAAQIVPFLVFIPIMYTLSEITVGGINFRKKTHLHLIISVIAAIANLSVVLLLVPLFGARGAALSTAFAYVIYFYLRTYFSVKYFPINFDLKKFSASVLILFVAAFMNSFFSDLPLLVLVNLASMGLILVLYKTEISNSKQYFRSIALRKR